jgi:transglutaminase-like putative cysteine protease
MYRSPPLLLALALSLFPASSLLAQSDPVRFGRVSAEDFRLEPAVPDTSATAIVLVDYGSTSFESTGVLVYERHRRIKILNEAGFDWGTHSITYYGGRDGQSVRDLRAQAYTLGADGRVTTHRLDRGSRFEENLDGERKRIRFTLPALAPGTIVEYRYTVTSPNALYAPNWEFQTSEPTLWSEYRFNSPGHYQFVHATNRSNSFHIEESNPSITPSGRGMLHRWVMKDVPALREEPFMTAISDHLAHLRFQLAAVRQTSTLTQRILSSWPEVAQAYREETFERLRRPGREVTDAASRATEGLTSDFDKMVAVYDHVRSSIRFTGGLGVIPSQEPREVLRTRTGNSPEIAFLLASMLRTQGLTASPVLISTRSRGRVIDVYPLLDQFNDVIVHVQTSDGQFLLDATSEHRPYNILHPEALNERGWLVTDREQRWIPVEAPGLYTRNTQIQAALDPTGALAGRISSRNDGYAAVEARAQLAADFDRSAFVREIVFRSTDDVEVIDHTLVDAETGNEQIGVDAEFRIGSFAQAAGDLLFFTPAIVGRHESNPFRLPTRSFPVDYTYPRSLSYELRLELPEGYRLLEHPPSRQLRHPAGGATYRRIVRMEDETLVVQTLLAINRVVFSPAEYPDLREFYTHMIASEAEQIVLTRAPAAADPEPVTSGDDSGPR